MRSRSVLTAVGPVGLILSACLLSPGALQAADLMVTAVDSACVTENPCYTSIQAAIDEALPGDRIQIQPGVYRERIHVRGKNGFAGAGHSDRIIIGRAEGAPPDSVILMGSGAGGGCRTGAVEIERSSHVTLSGLVITGFRGPAVKILGGPRDNLAIHLERNRIFGNGSRECSGGVVVEKGNAGTLLVNNLIYANGGHGVELSMAPARARGVSAETLERHRLAGTGRGEGLQVGGPHYLIQNTIHGNDGNGIDVSRSQEAILVNNAVTGNGHRRPGSRHGRGRRAGYGVSRDSFPDERAAGITLLNNLLCGNTLGESGGPVFVGSHADNLTPTGLEAGGVLASPECAVPDGVYADVAGDDGEAGTLDDDFTLTGPGAQRLPSPAIDRGTDPRLLGLDTALDPLLVADFLAPDVRPIQRDVNRPLDFDIGALELPCSCAENCETCQIVIGTDGSSSDRCMLTYDSNTQCCNRVTGEVSSKERGRAMEACPATRSPVPGFDPKSSADGCSSAPDRPLVLCPAVRFGCDFDAGEENCPAGIDLPCNNHDFCYQTCGRTQQDCDLEFLDDMLDVCDSMTAAQKVLCYDDCLAAALTYFDAVSLAGETSWVNGQNRSCQCCQDVFPPPVAVP